MLISYTENLYLAITEDFTPDIRQNLSAFLENVGTSSAARKLLPEKKKRGQMIKNNFQKAFSPKQRDSGSHAKSFQTGVTKQVGKDS